MQKSSTETALDMCWQFEFSKKLLNDNHINAAQILLKNQFPHIGGFIDTLI